MIKRMLLVLVMVGASWGAINSYKHVTAAGAGTKDGSTWGNAFGIAEFETFMEATVVAGDVIFVKDEAYTITSAIDYSLRDGTAASPIAIIGVKSGTTNEGAAIVYSDMSRDTADRPYFNLGTVQFKPGDYAVIRGISFRGEVSSTVNPGVSCVIENCAFDQNYGTPAARSVLNTGGNAVIVNCTFTSANCGAILLGSSGKVYGCTFTDLPNTTNGTAINTQGSGCSVIGNIFNTVKAKAVILASNDNNIIANNTFYDCAVDVDATDSYSNLITNNVHEATDTDGYHWTTQQDINFVWDNHGNDARNNDMFDLIDASTVFQDYEITTGDPLFVNTANDSLQLQATSPCLNTGTGAR